MSEEATEVAHGEEVLPENQDEVIEASGDGVEEAVEADKPDTTKQVQTELQFSPEQQQLINNIVGNKVSKTKQVETELAKTREELNALRQQLPEEKPPEIPEVPDAYDPDFTQKVAARDEAIRKAIEFDTKQKAKQEQNRAAQQYAMQRQVQQVQQMAQSYDERAKTKFGIRPEELAVAGQAVASSGISEALAQHILADEQGPAITMHLASNLAELHQLSTMSPMSAAAHLAINIKPKLGNKGAPQTAPPAATLTGGGVPKKERGPEGATFE